MNNIIKQVWNYTLSRKYIFLFSIAYFLIKLIRLDTYFLLRDERDLLLTALSLAQTGKDLYGHSFPIIFSRISPQAPLLGMYWTVPFLILFHITSPFMVKILYILPTIFFPLFVFELILSISKNWKLSFITALIVSFSPWYFHISRLAIEAHLAYFFCLLGLIVYLRNKKAFGFLLLVLSYFSYFGIRPFILISVPIIESWNYLISKNNKSLKNIVLTLIIFFLLFGAIYAFSTKIETTAARTSAEVIFLNTEKLTQEADFLRSISEVPFSIRGLFDNKVSIVFDNVFYNFFKGLDFSYLFFRGDYTAIYANQVTGQFFPFLSIFFVLGICSLAIKKRWEYYFIASLSLFGLISSLINSYSLTFSIRSSISLIGIGFICTLGILYVFELLKSKGMKSIFFKGIVILYCFFSIIFAYKYLFQNYNMINGSFNESERFVAHYITDQKVKTIVVPNIHSYFLSYITTLPSLTPELFNLINNQLNKSGSYSLNGHRFQQCDGERINFGSNDIIPSSTIIEESCLSIKTTLFIAEDKSGRIVKLFDPEYKPYDINKSVKYYFFK